MKIKKKKKIFLGGGGGLGRGLGMGRVGGGGQGGCNGELKVFGKIHPKHFFGGVNKGGSGGGSG